MIRVLIVDDHAIVRDGLRMILGAESDVEVAGEAATGHEAVDLAARTDPDVIVMDLAMPDLDGIEAARRIRLAEHAPAVVVLSMHATAEHLHRAFAAGVVGYVLKSSAGSEVVTAVRAAARGRRFLSPPLERLARELPEPDDGASPLERLTPREREVLHLVVSGRSSAEIAGRLGLTAGTVDTYRSRIMRKLGVDDLVGLVRFAVEHGLTPP